MSKALRVSITLSILVALCLLLSLYASTPPDPPLLHTSLSRKFRYLNVNIKLRLFWALFFLCVRTSRRTSIENFWHKVNINPSCPKTHVIWQHNTLPHIYCGCWEEEMYILKTSIGAGLQSSSSPCTWDSLNHIILRKQPSEDAVSLQNSSCRRKGLLSPQHCIQSPI